MSQYDLKSIQPHTLGILDYNTKKYFSELKKTTLTALKKDVYLYLLITAYLALGYSYLTYVDQISKSHFLVYFSVLLPLFFLLITPFVAIYTAIIIQRRTPNKQRLAIKIITCPKNITRYINGLVFLTIYCLFIGMFTSVKTSLSSVYGFQHDIYQADLDKLLFFGLDAWKVLFEPIHNAWSQPIIEFNYNALWHLQMYLILYIVATSYQSKEFRNRYLFSFMLVWAVVGNIFAGIFISAGPAFYGPITGDEIRFGEQLKMLSQHGESTAITFQNYLWTSYSNDSTGFGTGISAFPSVHVSICVLNTFFAFEKSRRLGLIALIYTIIISISSVYLAWHYFVDGLFGAVLVAIIYYATKYYPRVIKG